MEKSVKQQFEDYIKIIEQKLDEFLPVKYPEEIWESMRYSVLAGGKRLRPMLCLETCRVLSGSYEQAIPAACAIEMLHTQSLIHDDLPCMDKRYAKKSPMQPDSMHLHMLLFKKLRKQSVMTKS